MQPTMPYSCGSTVMEFATKSDQMERGHLGTVSPNKTQKHKPIYLRMKRWSRQNCTQIQRNTQKERSQKSFRHFVAGNWVQALFFIAFKRMYIVHKSFLTFPKYQK